MRIALVSRELHPVGGGGIGVAVAGFATALSEIADVTVVSRSGLEESFRELEARGRRCLPDEIQVEFVPEPTPGEYGSYYSYMHLYSDRVFDKLRELYPVGGPDAIEFPDFLGEGLVTVQHRRAHARFLRDTQVHVRLHTSAEVCSVLDGFVDSGFESRYTTLAERHVLREADRVLWPGGAVFDTYERFYGSRELAPDSRVRGLIALPPSEARGAASPPSAAQQLRLLYLGRLERRKGVQDLIRAVTSLRSDDWTLTLVGGDTDTAPLGMSMREQLELTAAGDPRIRFFDNLSRDELAGVLAESHVLVCPSLWECWPSVVLEALAADRPVIGTPTGGLVEMLAAPGAGWLTSGVGAEPIARTLEQLLARPEQVDELVGSGKPRAAYAELTDPDAFRAEYLEAAAPAERRSGATPRTIDPSSAELPLVSVVVPYFRLEEFIEDAVRSVFEQDYPRIELLVVNDGSLRPEDGVLADLMRRYPMRVLTQQNAGLGSARNAGIAQTRGAYVLPLDADNVLRPDFVSRCVEVLEREPDLTFVTTWSRYIDEDGRELEGLDGGYQPIGNHSPAVLDDNIAGDATGLFRKSVFDLGYWYSRDLTSYEDWQLYRDLHNAGLYGRAIPERLLLYRVRGGSMLRDVGLQQKGRLFGEMTAHLREREVAWVSRSA